MKNLKNLRMKHNLNQEQLAKIINVSRNTISQYESGIREPSFSTLLKLADYFNVTVDYLLGYEKNNISTTVEETHNHQNNLVDIGNKIKELRRHKNISQRRMAKDLNITNPSISMWENGIRNPDINTLMILSKYFNVPMSYFFNEKQNIINEEKPKIPDYQQKLLHLIPKLNSMQCYKILGYAEAQLNNSGDKNVSENKTT